MRFKILLIAGAAICFLIVALLFKRGDHPPQAEREDTAHQPASPSVEPKSATSFTERIPATSESFTNALTITTNQFLEKLAGIEQLATGDDPQALNELLVTLVDPNPKIRKATLDAIIQLGDRAAIPTLKSLAGKTDDIREKIALLDAAEFLQMPSLSELRAATNSRPIQPRQK